MVSPERILYSGDADDGGGGADVAFLADHAPFLGALEIHPVKIKTLSKEDTDDDEDEAA